MEPTVLGDTVNKTWEPLVVIEEDHRDKKF